MIPPATATRTGQGLARVRETGHARILDERLEATAMRADGSEFPVELDDHPHARAPVRFAGFVRDLTERVRAERTIAQLASER